ncbi:MAG: hypothetical protein II517_01150 [Ruminococcus sp.]|nr:hypothetical protein [Ruminococcus sp.]
MIQLDVNSWRKYRAIFAIVQISCDFSFRNGFSATPQTAFFRIFAAYINNFRCNGYAINHRLGFGRSGVFCALGGFAQGD